MNDSVRRSWQADMIAPLCDQGVSKQSSFVEGKVDYEGSEILMLHISAQGLYRAFINGQRVGDDQLTPGWTCYNDRIAYQSYDVTSLVRQGTNTIRIWLGDGWFRSALMWRELLTTNTWGDRIAAIAEFEAGGKVVSKTDSTWKSGLTPITSSGIYYGEDYDAREEDQSADQGVEVIEFDTSLLVPHETSAVKELVPIAPIRTWTDAERRTIYDFAQNVGGYPRISVTGKTGAKVLIEFSEVVGPRNEFDNRNYRSARASATYVLKGEGTETWSPAFTFFGFRFARVTITGDAEVQSIQSVPISSVPEAKGGFTCGELLANRLVENTVWSQRGNFIEVPTDCPQRDERLGWTGDAQVFAGTACWLADSHSFLRKYMRDLMNDQRSNGAISHFSPDPTLLNPNTDDNEWAGSTGWGDAITVIPWQLYLHYGDKEVLRECFPAMLKWLDYVWSISDGPLVFPSKEFNGEGFSFGDWLQPVGDNRKPRPTIGDDCAATLYHFISNDLAANIGRIIGEEDKAQACADRAAEIKKAFIREYFTGSGRLAHNDQTSYALAFLHDLVPAEYYEQAKVNFRRVVEDANYLIGTGFIGTPALLPALTKLGMNDIAEKVFLNKEVPGWLYQVAQGATTIWERWDAIGPDGTIYDPLMNSYNHYAYGAVCQWLFEAVGGVAPSETSPGFDEVSINPQILPAFGSVSMWHECRHGRIEAGWTLDDDTVTYHLTLPVGCTGRLTANPARKHVRIDGAATDVPESGATLGSGHHEVTFNLVS